MCFPKASQGGLASGVYGRKKGLTAKLILKQIPGELEALKRVQDAEQRSKEILEELQALQGQASSGARLLEQATAKVTAGEVALADARREI